MAYKTAYGRDLLTDLHKELSGDYRNAMEDLYEDPIAYDAKCLYKSMKGLGTDNDTLIELICSRPTSVLKEVSFKFRELYNKNLNDWIVSETSGDYRKLLVSIATCQRSENVCPDDEKMKTLAHQLYAAGEGRLGTDEQTFNTVFARSSPAELLSICNWYKKLTGDRKDLRTAIEKEFSGNLRTALLTVLDTAICPAEYFARRIKQSVKGLGTNEALLNRVLISREEIDMPEIRKKYQEIFGVDMIKDIEDDTSGNYRKILVGIASK
ncbi:MAG: annexin [archaeon]|nr:annexin [archaeon]